MINNSSLENLHVTNNRLGDDGAQSIAAALMRNTRLVRISLDRNQIGESGIASLCDVIRAKQKNYPDISLASAAIESCYAGRKVMERELDGVIEINDYISLDDFF